jgi:hypothetical protein
MRNITVTEESDDPTIGTHAKRNRMGCELGDCENSNKKEHKEIPETTDECEDEQLSTHGGGGNPNFVILT